jgi:pilus assembly protein Flp/PilA
LNRKQFLTFGQEEVRKESEDRVNSSRLSWRRFRLSVGPSITLLYEGENMFAVFEALIRDEEGATMVEYGLVIALIALVAMTAVQMVGKNLSTLFTTVAGSL